MSDTNETPRIHFSNLSRLRIHKKKRDTVADHPPPEQPDDPYTPIRPRRRRRKRPSFLTDPQARAAVYVAMAHAGLVLTLALLFGLVKLLQGYWRPIQWAILCSLPLRELQIALVSFWSHSLHLGLLPTLLAVPVAVLRAITASLIDSQSALLYLIRRPSAACKTIGFSKLMQWLVSFALFLVAYEHIGLLSVPILVLPCLLAHASGCNVTNTSTLSTISSVRRIKKAPEHKSILAKISRYITTVMLGRLKTTVGIGLILVMVAGSVFGFFFFSYKIGVESKDAVVSLKQHLEQNNYPERMGIKKWMDEKQIPELIDAYATKLYDTVSQNIDFLAMQYNFTDILDGVRHCSHEPRSSTASHSPVLTSTDDDSASTTNASAHLEFLTEKFTSVQSKVKNREWKLIFRETNGIFREFMSIIRRKDLLERIKKLVLQSVGVTKQVLASLAMIFLGGANLLLFMAVSIVSGAAELLNMISELMVFIWLLYYLITTESGGVMDQVFGMLPLSKSIRDRCGQVLDHAVKSVLVAAAKVTLYQGCCTYLLFRFYQIHFLYVSTFLALMTGVLPIVPCWIASVPAVGQLAMEARYIEAIVLFTLHFILLEYGTAYIQEEMPGQNAYLTGLSIFGGMALFPSYLEGAILGPVLMTVMIALKNLYVEFVLASANETS